jgi:hypothetical protein
MNRVMISILLGSSAALGAAAFAQDTSGNTSTHKTRKELMQQCMDQQKAQNSSATEKDMKKTCHDQVKTEIAQQQPAAPPPAGAPPYTPPSSPSSPAPR